MKMPDRERARVKKRAAGELKSKRNSMCVCVTLKMSFEKKASSKMLFQPKMLRHTSGIKSIVLNVFIDNRPTCFSSSFFTALGIFSLSLSLAHTSPFACSLTFPVPHLHI